MIASIASLSHGSQVAVITTCVQKSVSDTTKCTVVPLQWACMVNFVSGAAALQPGISVSHWELNQCLTCHRTVPATSYPFVSTIAGPIVGPLPVRDCLPM